MLQEGAGSLPATLRCFLELQNTPRMWDDEMRSLRGCDRVFWLGGVNEGLEQDEE